MGGRLTVLAGMPGAGKSHWRRNQPRDAVRNCLTLDGGVFKGDDSRARMGKLYGAARRLLADGLDVVADVTAVRSDDRAEWLALAATHGARATLVAFTTPVAVCVERNRRRPAGRRVPDERMAFYAGMHEALPRIASSEAWDEVVFVDGR